jgi:CheY-like chemotaxis protein
MRVVFADNPSPMKRAIILSKDNGAIEFLRRTLMVNDPGVALEVFENDHSLLERVYELRDTPPAHVFVDLDGFDDGARLVEWLRFSPPTRQLKLVALGQESASVDRFRRAWGHDAVVTKPLTDDAVRHTLMNTSEPPGVRRTTSRRADRQRLIDAIAEAKRLRAEKQRRSGHIDALMAEIKDKKLPFRRARVASPDAIALGGRTMLYVADNPANRHFFSTAMSQAGATFSAQFLGSLAEVVEHLREKGERRRITSDSPCCLLVDSSMADESTCDILRWIRSQSSFPELLLVVLGERDIAETIAAVYRAGADYYLVKPKSFEALIAMVTVIEAGLGQTPPQFNSFVRLSEYRDPMGNPVITADAESRAAE